MEEIVAAAPALGLAGMASAVALRSPQLLAELYGDLAKPGVSQVGKAIGSLLGLGNTILIPVRLMNESARAFEQWSFSQIASRFSSIPDDQVTEIPPEIGVPIIEKLSQTKDSTIREMFIELLAKSADLTQESKIHPSFCNVIASLSPDEAILLRSFHPGRSYPFVTVELKMATGSGAALVHDLVFMPPNEIVLPDNIPLYLSNLAGLGIIEIRRESYLTAPGAYDETERYARHKFKLPDVIPTDEGDRSVMYKKKMFSILPYGASFLQSIR